MKITCRLGNDIKIVEVSVDEPLSVLLRLLNIRDKNSKFIFNGRTYMLDTSLAFRDIGMTNDCVIFLINQAISGGGDDPNKFANLSEDFLRKDEVSKYNPNIPEWRCIGKGINLFGICGNENCRAKGKQVIQHVPFKQYDVYSEGFMGICPICKKHFDLDTCSFYKCDYKCEGTFFDKLKDTWVDLPDEIKKTSGGKNFYYDYKKAVRGKEGKVKYKKLILKVINYHDNE